MLALSIGAFINARHYYRRLILNARPFYRRLLKLALFIGALIIGYRYRAAVVDAILQPSIYKHGVHSAK